MVGRALPPAARDAGDRGARPPSVLLKLDAEGEELELLQRMLEEGVLCGALDYITWELHPEREKVRRPAT